MTLDCRETQWKERDAVRVTNGIVELIVLLNGGHLACFRFIEPFGASSQNVLWEAPWEFRKVGADWSSEASLQYGPADAGRFLAGFTGHALCLDYFGDPDPDKAASGLGLHGEAAVKQWRLSAPETSTHHQCTLAVDLPVSHLRFERSIQVPEQQSVVYVEERLYNESSEELPCNWVQHVTFGAPFLSEGTGTVLTSATTGITSRLGYDGKSLLPAGQPFIWPFVQLKSGNGQSDLRLPFKHTGKGFLVGTLMDPRRELEYLLAINWEHRLGVGYFFQRKSFPWMAVWEENCARQDPPWNGNTRARGMEFGTSPFPRSVGEISSYEHFGNAPTGFSVPPKGKRSAGYIMCLFQIPEGLSSIEDVVLNGDTLIFFGGKVGATFSIPATDGEIFLAESNAGQLRPK